MSYRTYRTYMTQTKYPLQDKFATMTEAQQIAQVKKTIKKYNKLAGRKLFLERNWSNTNWCVTELHWDKCPFSYDNRLWVLEMRMHQEIANFKRAGF
jgi:hypothetical protein